MCSIGLLFDRFIRSLQRAQFGTTEHEKEGRSTGGNISFLAEMADSFVIDLIPTKMLHFSILHNFVDTPNTQIVHNN